MIKTAAKPAGIQARPPVVVVLGHVDHGKTRLLDAVRQTNVIDTEAGGITQHIGAYQASVKDKLITFLDTPGHEAFSAIRSRGAKVADIAILVVAADESVKPQTKEAIQIIKEADIPYIVALNKMDKDGANPDKVRQDLATEEVLVEGWGGDIPIVEIAAKLNQGIDELLDMILLVADLQDYSANPSNDATGIIIESHLDKRRGNVATALVQDGTLRTGDYIVVGNMTGKARGLEDFNGNTIQEAGPSQPAVVIGWTTSPALGQPFRATNVKKVADEWQGDAVASTPLFPFFGDSVRYEFTKDQKVLNVIFKADVTSSLEALELSVQSIKSERVGFRVLDFGIGNITEQDVKTAASRGAVIMGFRVGIEPSGAKMAEKEGIHIQSFDIIYELVEAFRNEMADLLDPIVERTITGTLKILKLFKLEGRNQILGGRVTKGIARRGVLVDIVRGEDRVRLGKLIQLQHEKQDMDEVREGLEAGMRIDISDAKAQAAEGDVLELYEEKKVRQNL